MPKASFHGRPAAPMAILLVGSLTLGGCSTIGARGSQVLPQAAESMSATGQQWLDEAKIVYREDLVGEGRSPVRLIGLNEPIGAEVPKRIVAVQYPHPNGRRDVARAELIIVAPPDTTMARPATWRQRVSAWLDSSLPGVRWSPGVEQAKSLSISVAELQQLISATQATGALAGGQLRLGQRNTSLTIQITGRTERRQGTSYACLEELADRIMSQGRFMSYDGSTEAFFAQQPTVAPIRLPSVE